MNPRRGPTLGFKSRADFLAWVREKEGPKFFAGRTEQDVCNWFVSTIYGPQVLSAAFRRSIRALLAGQPLQGRPVGSHFVSQKNCTIFTLPPSPYWPRALNVPEDAKRLPFLHFINATEEHWRTDGWRGYRSIFFYGNWRELRAAYQTARLLLAGENAFEAVRSIRWIFVGMDHGPQFGTPEEVIALKAKEAGF